MEDCRKQKRKKKKKKEEGANCHYIYKTCYSSNALGHHP